MCCQNFWKKILVFSFAFLLSVSITALLQKELSSSVKEEVNSINKIVEVRSSKIPNRIGCESEEYISGDGIGSGSSGGDYGVGGGGEKFEAKSSITKPMEITFKPRPGYTDAARQNQVAGKVRLRVTFLASGQIGNVSPVGCLADGLTEQAITAAKNIKFKPATIDGNPMTVTKLVEYSFSIY